MRQAVPTASLQAHMHEHQPAQQGAEPAVRGHVLGQVSPDPVRPERPMPRRRRRVAAQPVQQSLPR